MTAVVDAMTVPLPHALAQKLPPLRPGERAEDALLERGLASERELALGIALAAKRRFTGLRDLAVNAGLFLYVPIAVAERELALPVVLVGDTLQVASAYYAPDLSLVRRRFPKLTIELVMALRSEVADALRRATGQEA